MLARLALANRAASTAVDDMFDTQPLDHATSEAVAHSLAHSLHAAEQGRDAGSDYCDSSLKRCLQKEFCSDQDLKDHEGSS